MADDADIAGQRMAAEEEARSVALAKIREAQALAVSAEQCVDCDVDLPDERRLAIPGVTLCVECQTFAEAKR